jgi:sirohydrochlorin ferrochelatase
MTAGPTPAPQRVAVVLVSHGDRGGVDPNATLRAQAKAVQALTGVETVMIGVLKGTPSLEEALETADMSGASEILLCPLFMAEGYFAGRVLPHRLSEASLAKPIRILQPLGLDPGMAGLVLADAISAAETAGYVASDSNLLVVGHGSKFGPASADATRKVAEEVAAAQRFASVSTAFLEEAPFVEDALTGLSTPTVVAGFFFGDGMHAAEDVPEVIARTRARAVYSGAIGSSPHIPELIAAAIGRALAPT